MPTNPTPKPPPSQISEAAQFILNIALVLSIVVAGSLMAARGGARGPLMFWCGTVSIKAVFCEKVRP